MKTASLLASLAYMALLFAASSVPDKAGVETVLSGLSSVTQNLLHIPAFGGLTFLWIKVLHEFRICPAYKIPMAAGIALCYGTGLELYQASVPGRFSSVMDLGLNLFGILSSLLVYALVKRHNILGLLEW